MTQKARSLFLNPMLKSKLREHAPNLVPVTGDIDDDANVYKDSKEAFVGYEGRARKWPRVCKLLFGRDEKDDPCFLHVDDSGDEEKLHPFTAYVDAVAMECGIEVRAPAVPHLNPLPNVHTLFLPCPVPQVEEVTPHLVAFLAYIAGQVANVATRTRGWNRGKQRGDIDDHTQWDAGIGTALRFMKNRSKCPTRSPMVLPIQKKKKRKA